MIIASILLTLIARPCAAAGMTVRPHTMVSASPIAQSVKIFGEENVFTGLAYTYSLKKSADSAAEPDAAGIKWGIAGQEPTDSAGNSTGGRATIKIQAPDKEFKLEATFPGQDPVTLVVRTFPKVENVKLIDAATGKDLKSVVFDGTLSRLQAKAKLVFKNVGSPADIILKATAADGATLSLNGETTSKEILFKGNDTFYVHGGSSTGSVVVSTLAKEEGKDAPSASLDLNKGTSPVSKIEALPETVSLFNKGDQTVKLTFLDGEGKEVSGRVARFYIALGPTQSRAPVKVDGSEVGTEVKLKGIAIGKAELVAKLLDPEGNPVDGLSVKVPIAVEPTPDRVVIEKPTSVLIRRQSYRYFVRLFDDQGNPVKDTEYSLTEVKLDETAATGDAAATPANTAISLSIDSESARKDDFIAQASEPGTFNIVATVTTSNGQKISGKVTLECVSLVDFSKIGVDIDPVDDNTVRDTFGPSIAKNYHVVKVRLLNDLRQLADGTDADSILVYGSSFDVGVRMYKKWVGKAPAGEEGWKPVEESDLTEKWSMSKSSDVNSVPREFQEAILPSGGQLGQMSIQQMPTIALAVGDMMRFRIPNVTNVKWVATPDSCASMGADDGVLVAQSPGLVRVEGTCSSTGNKGFYMVRVLPKTGTTIDLTHPITDVGTGYRMPIKWEGDGAISAEISPKGSASFDPESGLVAFNKAGLVAITFTRTKDGVPAGSLPVSFTVYDRNSLAKLPPSVYMTPDGLQYVTTRLRYRPLTTELMLLAHNSREFRTGDAGGRRFVDTVVQIVTLGVAANIFKGRTAEITTLAASALPPLFNIWTPDMSENHRAALLTQGMKSLEEVPFGAEIVRFVFFPKTDIYGVLPNKVVRIESVDTSQFFIPVGVIKRDGGGKGTASTTNPPVNSKGGG